ncbi:sulfite exporter tauE/SafE domain-containing protein [Purpureocillium lilacinum]|uniref:Sulfite exporter tauE/SafE domain-containing protein n=1 Tax=Purpureocillium lilacinum TaxID=33203 RepID=A0A179HGE0_PURLI|nr:sulfite exporter tauE/SafE domain-containing protein [Purpureocillium lilacinum]OAQ80054.1 sulfite exporter tauE/SafE domain-containing protein [Purpureocillium lilacinum]OAQ88543.1 sulfite exporter tauE/SafE domain-containing protein [Purpureocillium lilacinum]
MIIGVRLFSWLLGLALPCLSASAWLGSAWPSRDLNLAVSVLLVTLVYWVLSVSQRETHHEARRLLSAVSNKCLGSMMFFGCFFGFRDTTFVSFFCPSARLDKGKT